MATSPKFVCLFFLLTILVCSIQTYARDSQFFSKVTRNRDDAKTTTINPKTNNNYFTNNKVEDFVPLNKQEKKDEQPAFLPQTTETGYGLYGHETGLNAPSTTTTNSLYNMDENNNLKYENFNNYYKNNNENHEKNYTPELKGLSDTTYTEKTPVKDWSYTNFNDEGKFYENNNNKKNENFNFMNNNEYHHENHYEPESKGLSYNNGVGRYYGASSRYNNGAVEKQGMSDTRFMENGNYYYDVEADNNGRKYYYDNDNKSGRKYYYDVNNAENKYNSGNRETNYEDVYNNNNNKYNNKFYNGNGMQEEFDFDQP